MEGTSPISAGSGGKPETGDSRDRANPPTHTPDNPPANTLQSEKDQQEKRKHPASENALESAQDKNPVPPGATRE